MAKFEIKMKELKEHHATALRLINSIPRDIKLDLDHVLEDDAPMAITVHEHYNPRQYIDIDLWKTIDHIDDVKPMVEKVSKLSNAKPAISTDKKMQKKVYKWNGQLRDYWYLKLTVHVSFKGTKCKWVENGTEPKYKLVCEGAENEFESESEN